MTEHEIIGAFSYFWAKTHYPNSIEPRETVACEQCGAPFAEDDPDLFTGEDVTGCAFMATCQTKFEATCRKDRWLIVERELSEMAATPPTQVEE